MDLRVDVAPLTPAEAARDAWMELPWPRVEVSFAASRAMRASGEPGRDRQVSEL